jgi:hypothetical protein
MTILFILAFRDISQGHDVCGISGVSLAFCEPEPRQPARPMSSDPWAQRQCLLLACGAKARSIRALAYASHVMGGRVNCYIRMDCGAYRIWSKSDNCAWRPKKNPKRCRHIYVILCVCVCTHVCVCVHTHTHTICIYMCSSTC